MTVITPQFRMDLAPDLPPPPAPKPLAERWYIRWPRRLVAAALSIAIFQAALWLYKRHNDFPMDWHPDEHTKVAQIINGNRNYNHPQLMLEGTLYRFDQLQLQWKALNDAELRQMTVETGRWVSAFYAAIAVVALAWVGYAAGGLGGMVLMAVAVGLCPSLFVYAHYMKEDASLIVGVALVALTTRMVWDARWSWSQILCAGLVGAACAVAVSGKYVGIASLVPAIPMLILARKRNWSYWILWPLMFVGCFVVVGATINHRIFDDNWRILPHFENSLEAETEHGLTGHDSVTMPQPNTFSWSVVLSETLLPTKVLICAFGGLLLLVCWRRSLWDWWIAVYAVFWLGVVSYSAIPFHRYSLPPVLLAHVLGGMGAIFLTFLFRNWIWRAAVWVLCFGIIVHFQGGRVMDYLDGFRNDSRDRARHWIARNLPRNSVILSENYAKIVYPGVNLPGYRVQVTRYGPDYGDLRSLERRADYMVVADHTYLRFLEPQVIGEPGYEPIFERRRKWYRDLFESYELLWSTSDEPQMRAFTNPEIRIYKLKGGRKSNDSEPAIRNP